MSLNESTPNVLVVVVDSFVSVSARGGRVSTRMAVPLIGVSPMFAVCFWG